MVSQFAGKKYKLQSSENFDEFMKAIAIPDELREIGNKVKTEIELTVNGDTYTLHTYSSARNNDVSFKLGEEFDQHLFESRTVRTVFTVDGNKITEEHKGEHPAVIVREFSADGVKITSTAGSVVAVRTYKAA